MSAAPVDIVGQRLETVQTFIRLLDDEMKYDEASRHITDDFNFVAVPFHHLKSKEEWLLKFPKLHQDKPDFEAVRMSDDGITAIRNGVKKLGFLNITMKEIIDFNEDGTKIKRITAKKA